MVLRKAVLAAAALAAGAVTASEMPPHDETSAGGSFERVFEDSAPRIELSQAELVNLGRLREFRSGVRALQTATVNPDGQLVFTFGGQLPSLVCSPLQVSDIELEPGELIQSVYIGDNSRWDVQKGVSGKNGEDVEHVVLRPLDYGLSTSMIIATDRRTYRIQLKSGNPGDQFMPSVTFAYPERIAAENLRRETREREERERQSIPVNGEGAVTYLGDLNFEYEVEGDVSWKPVRVFDDGHKTVIEMPKRMEARSAPSLLILEEPGGIISDEKLALVNYRLQGNRYIVDGLFDSAVLTLGTEDDEQRVVITRRGGGY